MNNQSASLPPVSTEQALALDNQLCFALYVCSKEIIRRYKPLLDPLHLTYTGYITMLALWEREGMTVKALGERLTLDSGTLTPLLKKLETLSYLRRVRSSDDERSVIVKLTEEGRALRERAAKIPTQMLCASQVDPARAVALRDTLRELMKELA